MRKTHTLRVSEAFLSSISSCIIVEALLALITAARARIAATASAKSGWLRHLLNSSITEKLVSLSVWEFVEDDGSGGLGFVADWACANHSVLTTPKCAKRVW